MSNSTIIKKVRILAGIIILVIGFIILTQVSWVMQTYERSKKAIRGNLQGDLEMMIGLHEQEVADSIRKLLKEIIQINPSFDYKISGGSIGYRYAENAFVRFKINSLKGSYSKNEAYEILQNELNNAPLAELRAVYSSLIGPRDFTNTAQASLAKQLMSLNNAPFPNIGLLNKTVKRTLDNQEEKFHGSASYLPDIDQLNVQQRKSRASTRSSQANGQEEIVEVIAHEEFSLDEKLYLIDQQIDKLNAKGDSVYVAKPLLDNVDMQDQIPVILLTVKLPASFAIRTMLNLAITLTLLMLFLGGSIIYLFYLILKQKKLSEIKDDFISNVSHELKTPVATTLAAIQGMQHFEVLKNKDKTDHYLNTAANEMQRLSGMIDTILNSAIYERSDFTIHQVKFNLKEMLTEMINIQESHSKKEVKIELNYQAKEVIFADQTHLYNVLINLVDNAIKYGNEIVKVKIECVSSDSGLKIQIADNGNGIPTAYQKNIFDKFFRVPSPNDHSIKGHGLGLNYVKNIIEKHKGTVALIKSDNKGSIFEINLPQ